MSSSQGALISATTLLVELDQWQVLEAGVDKVAPARQLFETQGHVPGAQLVDVTGDFTAPHAAYPYQRPERAQFAYAASRAGLLREQGVVIYDRYNGIWAARLWWLLRAFGHAEVRVLDGGMAAWQAAGLPLAFASVSRPASDYQATALRPGYFVDLPLVQAISLGQRPEQLLNVLRRPVFTGAEQRYARGGHIPGSLHLAYAEVLDEHSKRFLGAPALRRRFASLDLARPIVTYCGSGITAAGMALALTIAGRDDVSIYDGSLSEWSAHPELPLVTLEGR